MLRMMLMSMMLMDDAGDDHVPDADVDDPPTMISMMTLVG